MKGNTKYSDNNADEINLEALGEIIRNKRREVNTTPEVIGAAIGRSRSYMFDIEAGRYMPSVVTLIRLAKALDIDLNILKDLVEVMDIETVEQHKQEYVKKRTYYGKKGVNGKMY